MNQPNPAWKPILDKLPPDYHKMIIPQLEEWDKGIQAKFDEIHKGYESLKPFQAFVDNNIAPDYAWKSVEFAAELQRDPVKVASQINEAFELGFIDKDTHAKALAEAVPADSSDDGDLFEDGKVDLSKIPEFQTMKQTLEAMQNSSEEQRRQEEEAAELAQFEQELDALEEANKDKPFNRTVVTAFMAQGLNGEEAVKQFHQLLAGTVSLEDETDDTSNTGDAPITMGNSGTVGSGTDSGAVNYSAMPTSEFNQNVAKILEAQLGQNT